ncbi:hypothetical protein [Streptomyces nigrescens]
MLDPVPGVALAVAAPVWLEAAPLSTRISCNIPLPPVPPPLVLVTVMDPGEDA